LGATTVHLAGGGEHEAEFAVGVKDLDRFFIVEETTWLGFQTVSWWLSPTKMSKRQW
jgi:hypothetical protein